MTNRATENATSNRRRLGGFLLGYARNSKSQGEANPVRQPSKRSMQERHEKARSIGSELEEVSPSHCMLYYRALRP